MNLFDASDPKPAPGKDPPPAGGPPPADRLPPAAVLAVLFLLASGACVAIPMANDWVNDWNWKPKPGQGNWFVWTIHYLSDGGKGEDDRILLPWSGRIFGHVLVVFLLPSTVLGTIGPVVAKMALDQGRKPGS